MTTKQKIHQANLAKWASLCREQAASGLTVKNWCSANDISIHAYNYWKHKLKLAAAESAIPDIVAIAPIDVESTVVESLPHESDELCDSHDAFDTSFSQTAENTLSISFNDIHMDIGTNTSDDLILKIIEVIRHA